MGVQGGGESKVGGMGVLEPGEREWETIWRADPKIEPCGLDIGGTSEIPPAGGGVDLYGAGQIEIGELRGAGTWCARGGAIWRPKLKIER